MPVVRMGTIRGLGDLRLRDLLLARGAPMPPWLEVLLNVIAFAGFIGIAKHHKSRGQKLPDR
jgi:hypothetical protein